MARSHFVYSSVDVNLDRFYFGAIVNSVAVNIFVQVALWMPVFHSFGYIAVCDCWII